MPQYLDTVPCSTAAFGGPILEVRGIVKTFPGVRALDSVDFELRRGEVHAVGGENGAGKSTLMHILGRILQPDSGEIHIDGQCVQLKRPSRAAQHRISVVFQELSLVSGLSIAENIFANRAPVRRCGFINRARLYAETATLLDSFGLDLDPGMPVKRLSLAHQQVVEILKAISYSPKVLILDEPTSSLTRIETRQLFDNIRRMKTQGISFIYVSPHLPEIFHVADRVTVLRDGKSVGTWPIAEVREEDLIRKMVGHELVNLYDTRASEIGEECFRAEGAGRESAFHGVSFSLRHGEILGIAGLVGAGRTELARTLCGAEPLRHGRIYLNRQPVQIRSPREAIAHCIAYLTEDRKNQGLFLRMTVCDNCAAPNLTGYATPLGFLDQKAMVEFAEACRTRFDIVAPSVTQRVANLSGGNQQKVLLAMWVGIQPQVLIADEPARGVDVGAKSEIYARLRELAAAGVGTILISADLSEILGLSDRILVMRQGAIVGKFDIIDATEEKIIACPASVELSAGV